MLNVAKTADVSTFQKLCGAMTQELSIRSSWVLHVFFAHLSTHFQAVLFDFEIRLLQI